MEAGIVGYSPYGKVLAPGLCALGRHQGQIRLESLPHMEESKPVCWWGWRPGVGQYDAAMGDGQLEWPRLLVPQHRTCLRLRLGRKSAFPHRVEQGLPAPGPP